jgi:hypothetical protein
MKQLFTFQKKEFYDTLGLAGLLGNQRVLNLTLYLVGGDGEIGVLEKRGKNRKEGEVSGIHVSPILFFYFLFYK